MKNKMFISLLLAVTIVTAGAGLTLAAHPDIPLYTYEEIGMQFTPNFNPGAFTTAPPVPGADFNLMPVMVNAEGKGFPYSPKMTCGNCHNGTSTSWDGQWTGSPLVSYQDMTTQAFHSELGAQEWQDRPTSSTKSSPPGKPWSQTNGMWGKW